jgi:hypothetical protein
MLPEGVGVTSGGEGRKGLQLSAGVGVAAGGEAIVADDRERGTSKRLRLAERVGSASETETEGEASRSPAEPKGSLE